MTAENIITEADSIQAAKKLRRIEQKRQARARHEEKTQRVSVSLSAEEYALLCRRAEVAGRKPTAFLKELAFRQLRRQNNFIVPVDLENGLSQLIEQTRKLGTNVNQLAKEGYIHGVNSTKLEQARQVIFQLEDTVKNFVRNPSVEK